MSHECASHRCVKNYMRNGACKAPLPKPLPIGTWCSPSLPPGFDNASYPSANTPFIEIYEHRRFRRFRRVERSTTFGAVCRNPFQKKQGALEYFVGLTRSTAADLNAGGKCRLLNGWDTISWAIFP